MTFLRLVKAHKASKSKCILHVIFKMLVQLDFVYSLIHFQYPSAHLNKEFKYGTLPLLFFITFNVVECPQISYILLSLE